MIWPLRRSSALVFAVEADDLLNLREKILALVPRSKVARLGTKITKPSSKHRAWQHVPVLASVLIARLLPPSPRQSRPATSWRSSTSRAMTRHRAKGALPPTVCSPACAAIWLPKPRMILQVPYRLYVVENLRSAKVSKEPFERDPSFNLQAFANRAFGVFQNEDEFGEVVWPFSPEAASHARGFEFHPGQVVEDQPDGSLIVRFSAAGHLEMCWHLYLWGDDVEVLAPERLRDMVHSHRRSDFPSLP